MNSTLLDDELSIVYDYLECDPSKSKLYLQTFDRPNTRPIHSWQCYDEANVEGKIGCGCSRFYTYGGPTCSDYSPTAAYL